MRTLRAVLIAVVAAQVFSSSSCSPNRVSLEEVLRLNNEVVESVRAYETNLGSRFEEGRIRPENVYARGIVSDRLNSNPFPYRQPDLEPLDNDIVAHFFSVPHERALRDTFRGVYEGLGILTEFRDYMTSRFGNEESGDEAYQSTSSAGRSYFEDLLGIDEIKTEAGASTNGGDLDLGVHSRFSGWRLFGEDNLGEIGVGTNGFNFGFAQKVDFGYAQIGYVLDDFTESGIAVNYYIGSLEKPSLLIRFIYGAGHSQRGEEDHQIGGKIAFLELVRQLF